MRLIIAILIVLTFTSCEPVDHRSYEQRNNSSNILISNDKDRFEVIRVQVIRDDLAYDYKRGIYVIKDTETGKEYIGISGIGISELGSHTNGKVTVSDER